MRLPRPATASVLASTLLAAGLSGCTAHDGPAQSGSTIVIGADLNNASTVDTAYARALRLRIDQVNASGQLGARKLELRAQDNHADPAASLRNLGAFADDPAVAAVITGTCDDCVVNSAKTIDEKRLPTIALAASDAVATPVNQRRYVFKLGPNSADSSAALTGELSRLRVPNVALVAAGDDYGTAAAATMRLNLRKAGIALQGERTIKPTADDVAQTMSALTADKPAALVVLTAPEQATLAATGARAAGYRGRIFFDAAAAGDLFIPPAAAAATNDTTMVFTQTLAIDDVIATTPAKASRKQWFRDYTSRYGNYSGVAAFAADAADLVADAVARVGADRDRIRDILETSQVDGLSGPIRLTPDNHSGLMPQALTLLVARAGRWRLAS